MASKLWHAMQLIESNRHVAEQLEIASSTADPALASLLADVARRRRKIAEEMNEQYRRYGVVADRAEFNPRQKAGQLPRFGFDLALCESSAANDRQAEPGAEESVRRIDDRAAKRRWR